MQLLLMDRKRGFPFSLLNRLREAGFEVTITEDVEDAKLYLMERKYDLIMLQSVGSRDEIVLFEFIMQRVLLKWVPIIVITSGKEQQEKSQLFEMGASEYLVEPVEFIDLQIRIKSLLEKASDFEKVAFRDNLTKVYNRRFFDHQIEFELERTVQKGIPISLSFIDADRFKSVNDTYGHHVGDLVLKGLAKLIETNIGPMDIVARYGGEEFVIIMPGADQEAGYQKMNRVLEVAHQEAVAEYDDRPFFITFSAGVCEWKMGMDKEEWIKLADDAAYEAKRRGRNQVVHAIRNENKMVEEEDAAIVNIVVYKGVNESLEGLRQLGADVQYIDEVPELLRYLQDGNVDLCIIFADKKIFGLIDQLKMKLRVLPKMILVSSTYSENEIMNCLRMGIEEYMVKPIEEIDLTMAYKRLLRV